MLSQLRNHLAVTMLFPSEINNWRGGNLKRFVPGDINWGFFFFRNFQCVGVLHQRTYWAASVITAQISAPNEVFLLRMYFCGRYLILRKQTTKNRRSLIVANSVATYIYVRIHMSRAHSRALQEMSLVTYSFADLYEWTNEWGEVSHVRWCKGWKKQMNGARMTVFLDELERGQGKDRHDVLSCLPSICRFPLIPVTVSLREEQCRGPGVGSPRVRALSKWQV